MFKNQTNLILHWHNLARTAKILKIGFTLIVERLLKTNPTQPYLT